MQMGAACFLNLYEESFLESGMNPAAAGGTKTLTENKETPDRDIGFAAAATKTFTRVLSEEPDQDQGTTQYMGIPRIAE